MTIHPLPGFQEATAQDTAARNTLQAQTEEVPTQAPDALEQVMLAEDKLYVVLAVVLIIWLGLVFFLFRTDRKLDRLERTLDADRSLHRLEDA
ncbi:MAG: CcmD family protein [Rhodothermales bacterium]